MTTIITAQPCLYSTQPQRLWMSHIAISVQPITGSFGTEVIQHLYKNYHWANAVRWGTNIKLGYIFINFLGQSHELILQNILPNNNRLSLAFSHSGIDLNSKLKREHGKFFQYMEHAQVLNVGLGTAAAAAFTRSHFSLCWPVVIVIFKWLHELNAITDHNIMLFASEQQQSLYF